MRKTKKKDKKLLKKKHKKEKRIEIPKSESFVKLTKKGARPDARHPLVETEHREGTASISRYYGYNFAMAPGISDDYLLDAAEHLTGDYPNVGDFYLRVGQKFVGAHGVRKFSLVWDREIGTELLLYVQRDGVGNILLGGVKPTDDKIDFVHTNRGIVALKTKVVTINALGDSTYQQQRTFGVTQAAHGTNGKGTQLQVENKTAVPVDATSSAKGNKRYNVFEHPVTAIIRWMGANAWTSSDCRKAFDKLGLPVSDTTIGVQLSLAKGERKPIPTLTSIQSDQLHELIEEEEPTPEPEVKKKKKKKLKHRRD